MPLFTFHIAQTNYRCKSEMCLKASQASWEQSSQQTRYQWYVYFHSSIMLQLIAASILFIPYLTLITR